MKNLKILFFGTPTFVVPVLEALDKNFEIVGVVTTPDEKIGRKQILTATPIAQYAEHHHIPVFKPEKLNNLAVQQLSNSNPDLIVVASYGKIIPQSILDIPKYGALNIHPSLLPKYRGAAPVQTAILNGDKTSAITIIQMDAEMDHGPIVLQEEFDITEKDTFATLIDQVFKQATEALIKLIPLYIAGKAALIEQDHDKATYTKKRITKEDGYFDINNPPAPEILDRMIRAYYPWPGVWCKWTPSRHPEAKPKDLKIIKFLPGGLIQMEGKNPVTIKEFLNGHRDFPIAKILARDI